MSDQEKYLLIWQKYRELKQLSQVIRSGFGVARVYPYDPRVKFDQTRSESVLEHIAGVTNLLILVAVYFPDVISWQKLPELIVTSQHHEIGENIIGDLADDGRRDEAAKNRIEAAAMEKYCANLPDPFGQNLNASFRELQQKDSEAGQIVFCADKNEAPLQGLIYEAEGRRGDVIYRMSEQDRRFAEITGTTSLVDIWACHVLQLTRGMYGAEIFEGILRAAVIDVRGKWFDWDEK